MALELLSALCTFENSTKCNELSFDADSFRSIQKQCQNITLPGEPEKSSHF